MSRKRMILVTKDNIKRLYGIIKKNMLSYSSPLYWNFQVDNNIKNHIFKAACMISEVSYDKYKNKIIINTNAYCGNCYAYAEIKIGHRIYFNGNKLILQRNEGSKCVYAVFTSCSIGNNKNGFSINYMMKLDDY